MKRAMIAVLLFTALAGVAGAQTSHKSKPWQVSISPTSSDSVGQAFIYAVKEQLNRSTTFAYTTDTATSLNLSMLTVNADTGDDDNNNHSAAVSIVLVGKRSGELDWFMDQWIFVVGKNRVDEMAKDVLVHLNYDVDRLQKLTDSIPTDNPQISRN